MRKEHLLLGTLCKHTDEQTNIRHINLENIFIRIVYIL